MSAGLVGPSLAEPVQFVGDRVRLMKHDIDTGRTPRRRAAATREIGARGCHSPALTRREFVLPGHVVTRAGRQDFDLGMSGQVARRYSGRAVRRRRSMSAA